MFVSAVIASTGIAIEYISLIKSYLGMISSTI